MTVSSETTKIAYAGDGSTVAFSVPFYFLVNGDIQVILVDSDDVETVQTETTHYTVAGAGEAAGGTITMVTAPAAGESLVIRRSLTATQDIVDLTATGQLPAETLEKGYDRGVMLIQEDREVLARSLKLSAGLVATFDPTLPAPVAGAILGINDDADGLSLSPSGLASYVSAAQAAKTAAESAQTAAEAANTAAQAAKTAAETAEDGAEAAQASLSLPTMAPGDAGKMIKVKAAEDGYEFLTPGAKGLAILQDAANGDVLTELGVSSYIQGVLPLATAAAARLALKTISRTGRGLSGRLQYTGAIPNAAALSMEEVEINGVMHSFAGFASYSMLTLAGGTFTSGTWHWLYLQSDGVEGSELDINDVLIGTTPPVYIDSLGGWYLSSDHTYRCLVEKAWFFYADSTSTFIPWYFDGSFYDLGTAELTIVSSGSPATSMTLVTTPAPVLGVPLNILVIGAGLTYTSTLEIGCAPPAATTKLNGHSWKFDAAGASSINVNARPTFCFTDTLSRVKYWASASTTLTLNMVGFMVPNFGGI